MKKKNPAEKYMYVITKRPIVFYTFLCLGVTLFLYLTLSTKIDTAEGLKSLLYIIVVKAGKII